MEIIRDERPVIGTEFRIVCSSHGRYLRRPMTYQFDWLMPDTTIARRRIEGNTWDELLARDEIYRVTNQYRTRTYRSER